MSTTLTVVRNMMKKLLFCLILLFNSFMGKSQDCKSEFNNLFLNLPIEDSIENIINGEFGYTIDKKNYGMTSGKIDLYYFSFSNHNYLKDTPGIFAIIKTKYKDSTVTYEIHLTFAFTTEENQMNGYELIKGKFSKCSAGINSRELKDTKNKLYGYATEIQFENYRIELTAFKAKKKQEHQVKIEYKLRKR